MNAQRFVCVWFDYEMNQSKDYLYTQDELRTVIESFRIFNNIDQCINCVINMENVNIIFITLNEDIIPIIHSWNQINSIFVFNSHTYDTKSWIKEYKKIHGIFADISIICQKIKENIVPSKTNPSGIAFLSSIDINSTDINRQDPTFMYSQLLKEIILDDDLDESDEETKNEMIEYCRQIYSNDGKTLKILDDFEENFLSELSIYWYTRESFLYKILNRALWTSQPDVLYKLRYFLRQLHEQISSQAEFQQSNQRSLIVYRGQNMSGDQVEKLKANVGGFISFNNFLSTSLKRQIALSFIAGFNIGVLFEIYIDTKIEKFPFANIEHLSYQQGKSNESELLFSMGTVFRMVGIDTEDDFYRVQLMLTNDIDQQLDQYTKDTRDKTYSTHSFLSLLKLMYELKQYNSVDCFAQIFHDDKSFIVDEDLHNDICNIFGLTCLHRGQFHNALEHFNKSLNICLNALSIDHSKLAAVYDNIGSVHSAQLNYETAVKHYELAIDCEVNSDDPDLSLMIRCAINAGSLLHKIGEYENALELYKHVLEFQKEYLGENDKSLTHTYNTLSTICYEMDDYEGTTLFHEKAIELNEDTSQLDPEAAANCALMSGTLCTLQEQYNEALGHFKRALHIQQQYFLSNNPELAKTYARIADTYYIQNQFEQSLSNHMKALDIQINSLSNKHPSIGISYFHISKDFLGLTSWSDALEYGFKAIEQIKKTSQMHIETLLSYIDYIASIYCQKNDYEKALVYHKEALDLSLNYLPDEETSLVERYYQIGKTYQKLEKYEVALEFYRKKLNLELTILLGNAKTIATTYADISSLYLHLDQLDDALIAANQAHDQLLKTLPYDHPEVLVVRDTLDKIKRLKISQKARK